MSMEQKAFLFRYAEFNIELRGLIESSLDQDTLAGLKQFISSNMRLLKDPYEGEPLRSDFEEMIEIRDASNYADFAITKFYNPKADIGLGYQWTSLDDILSKDLKQILLGEQIGTAKKPFDPGKMGSWFQSEMTVKRNLGTLNEFLDRREQLRPTFSKARRMLESASTVGMGLYITF